MPRTILVRDYMTPSPHSIGVSLPVNDAKKLMTAHGIRHLPVLDGGRLVGVVSDRDVQMVEAFDKQCPSTALVEEAMAQAPYTAAPSTPLEVAARHMARHKLGSCVVMDGERVVGVLTTTDGMRALADLLEGSDGTAGRGA
jgi:acetoin utilization protein AcuB